MARSALSSLISPRVMVATAVAAAAMAVTAKAQVAPVTLGVGLNDATITAKDLTVGVPTHFEVWRSGVRIAQTTTGSPANRANGGGGGGGAIVPGALDVNGGVAGDVCWTGAVPQMRGGDLVRVVQAPTGGVMTTTGTTARAITIEQTSPLRSGQVVTVRGTAIDPTTSQRPPVAQLTVTLRNTATKVTLVAPQGLNTVAYDVPADPTNGSWTATYTLATSNDAQNAASSDIRFATWTSPAATESTTASFSPGAVFAAPCPAVPSATTGPVGLQVAPADDTGASDRDGITKIAQPHLIGVTSASNMPVTIRQNTSGAIVAAGTSGVDGAFDLVPTAPLPQGQLFLRAFEGTSPGVPAVNPIQVTVDSVAPADPSMIWTPGGPSPDPAPTFGGDAEPSTSVAVYAATSCSGTPVATLTALQYAFGVPIPVVQNGSTPVRVRVTDAAGNAGNCAVAPAYVHDSIAPPAPLGLGTTPASPTWEPVALRGAAEAGSTVSLFANATCAGTPFAQGSAAALGGAGIPLPIPATPTSYDLSALATDAAGNVSLCSTSIGFQRIAPPSPPPPPAVITNAPPRSGSSSVVSRVATMSRTGAVTVLVRCSGGDSGGTCAATLELTRRIPAAAARGVKARTVTYARRAVIALNGTTVRVTLLLTPAGRRAVTSARRLGLSMRLTATGGPAAATPIVVRGPPMRR